MSTCSLQKSKYTKWPAAANEYFDLSLSPRCKSSIVRVPCANEYQ